MMSACVSRRLVLGTGVVGTLSSLAGCATPLPLLPQPPASDSGAERLLHESAEAHGLEAYRRLADINVRYDGRWRPLIDRVQPLLVDRGFRGSSEERLMPHVGVVAQTHTGPAGRKHVAWRRGHGGPERPGEVAVWFDGRRSTDPEVLDAAALVAEGYGLFLLGPLWTLGRALAVQPGGRAQVDGCRCDVVQVWLHPGLGRSPLDRLTLFIDSGSRLLRRVRFTLEGYSGTRGAVAQVDAFAHQRRFGVAWPSRWYEEVVHPIRLPAHDWRLAGLDVDRGYGSAALDGPTFGGTAAAAAAAL